MRGLDSILSLIDGKEKPVKVTAVRPSKALIINAVEGVKISAIIPTNSAPSGDVPIAKVTTPNVINVSYTHLRDNETREDRRWRLMN